MDQAIVDDEEAMQIRQVHVQRFRSIYDASLACDRLTALVGANGAGKSTFLRALAVFYNPTADIDAHDFYDTAVDDTIRITVSYTDLTDTERAAFSKYVHSDELTVEKRIHWDADRQKAVQAYYGFTLQHPPFAALRDPSTPFNARRAHYNTLRSQPGYATLPGAAQSDAILRTALDGWERARPEQCALLPSVSQFFGFKQASAARLELYTRFLLIEAQRDAHLAALDERDSPIKQLLDEVLRNVVAENAGVQVLQQQALAALKAISAQIDLRPLNDELNATMQQFAPNTRISLQWRDAALSLPTPKVQLSLSEDDYDTPINRTGHGVQRAFIITLLQHLAMSARQAAVEAAPVPAAPVAFADAGQSVAGVAAPAASETGPVVPPQPNLILAIEEPELYQHPTRQRHFAAILRDLANGAVRGVANSIQVLYCTHSPYFVDIGRFEQIRVIAKVAGPSTGTPKCTGVRATTRAALPALSEAQLTLMMNSTVNEGFFARLVVLVEGDGDRAFLQAVARHFEFPLEAHGVAIVAVEGKGNFNKPLLVFRAVGIDVYPIWDTDRDKTGDAHAAMASENRRLLALCQQPEQDWPIGSHRCYAVFDPKLEAHIRAEVEAHGIAWSSVEREANRVAGRGNTWKKYAAVSHAAQYAISLGCTFPATQSMLRQISVMAGIALV